MTNVIALALRCDGLSDLVITDDAAFCYVDLDLGYPVPRGVVEDRADQNGTSDTTDLFGARAVSLTLLVQDTDERSVQASVNRIKPFLNPARRPYLYFTLADDVVERRIMLRANQLSDPLEAPWWNDARRMQIGWVGPDGVVEAADDATHTIEASGTVELGRSYDLVYPRVYPAASPIGVELVTLPSADDGALAVAPVIRLYGPCTDPRIQNVTTGQAIIFSGLTLAAGVYVEIDVRARTALLNGAAGASEYQLIDFAASEWWELQPGDNQIRYYPASFSAGAAAVMMWRPAWL